MFPKNNVDSIENVLRLCTIDNSSKIDEYRSKLNDIDLCRPLTLSSLHALLKTCIHPVGKMILSTIIDNSECDNLQDLSNTNPMLEEIIGKLKLHV